MKKKLILMMVTVVLCLSFSATAFALTEGDWEFQLLDDEVTITGYLGDDEEIVVPDEIFGRPVTKVELDAWEKNFEYAESLEYPGTVKIIENNGVGENLEQVILNEGTEEIEWEAFYGCGNLENINIPLTVRKIDDNAFDGCGSLTKIELHKGIKEIGKAAFAETSIKSVDLNELPDDCIIGEWLFSGCKKLETIIWNPNFKEIPRGTFYECISLTNVELPSGVEIIEWGAFDSCAALEEIIFPTSLKTIGYEAFRECKALKEVTIPYGTESISSAFVGCDNLKSMYLPDTISDLSGYVIEDSNNCIIYCTAGSYAAGVCKEYSISYLTDNSVNSLITVYYNGTRISFHEQGQNPELINSRTLVPLRAIFEAMDAEVEWDQATKTVTATRGGVKISLAIGANVMYKNGEEIAVDVPAQLINDRTMIPVRVIAEAFGAEVEWNNNGRAVLIEE